MVWDYMQQTLLCDGGDCQGGLEPARVWEQKTYFLLGGRQVQFLTTFSINHQLFNVIHHK